MSTSEQNRKTLHHIAIDKHIITCPLCMKHYTEPKLLSCLHTVCKQCLVTLYTDSSEPKAIECPMCGDRTLIDDDNGGSIAKLQDNYYVRYLVNKVHEQRVEDLCDLCENTAATVKCTTCVVNLCGVCADEHMRNQEKVHHQFAFLMEDKIEKAELDKMVHTDTRTTETLRSEDELILPYEVHCKECDSKECQHCSETKPEVNTNLDTNDTETYPRLKQHESSEQKNQNNNDKEKFFKNIDSREENNSSKLDDPYPEPTSSSAPRYHFGKNKNVERSPVAYPEHIDERNKEDEFQKYAKDLHPNSKIHETEDAETEGRQKKSDENKPTLFEEEKEQVSTDKNKNKQAGEIRIPEDQKEKEYKDSAEKAEAELIQQLKESSGSSIPFKENSLEEAATAKFHGKDDLKNKWNTSISKSENDDNESERTITPTPSQKELMIKPENQGPIKHLYDNQRTSKEQNKHLDNHNHEIPILEDPQKEKYLQYSDLHRPTTSMASTKPHNNQLQTVPEDDSMDSVEVYGRSPSIDYRETQHMQQMQYQQQQHYKQMEMPNYNYQDFQNYQHDQNHQNREIHGLKPSQINANSSTIPMAKGPFGFNVLASNENPNFQFHISGVPKLTNVNNRLTNTWPVFDENMSISIDDEYVYGDKKEHRHLGNEDNPTQDEIRARSWKQQFEGKVHISRTSTFSSNNFTMGTGTGPVIQRGTSGATEAAKVGAKGHPRGNKSASKSPGSASKKATASSKNKKTNSAKTKHAATRNTGPGPLISNKLNDTAPYEEIQNIEVPQHETESQTPHTNITNPATKTVPQIDASKLHPTDVAPRCSTPTRASSSIISNSKPVAQARSRNRSNRLAFNVQRKIASQDNQADKPMVFPNLPNQQGMTTSSTNQNYNKNRFEPVKLHDMGTEYIQVEKPMREIPRNQQREFSLTNRQTYGIRLPHNKLPVTSDGYIQQSHINDGNDADIASIGSDADRDLNHDPVLREMEYEEKYIYEGDPVLRDMALNHHEYEPSETGSDTNYSVSMKSEYSNSLTSITDQKKERKRIKIGKEMASVGTMYDKFVPITYSEYIREENDSISYEVDYRLQHISGMTIFEEFSAEELRCLDYSNFENHSKDLLKKNYNLVVNVLKSGFKLDRLPENKSLQPQFTGFKENIPSNESFVSIEEKQQTLGGTRAGKFGDDRDDSNTSFDKQFKISRSQSQNSNRPQSKLPSRPSSRIGEAPLYDLPPSPGGIDEKKECLNEDINEVKENITNEQNQQIQPDVPPDSERESIPNSARKYEAAGVTGAPSLEEVCDAVRKSNSDQNEEQKIHSKSEEEENEVQGPFVTTGSHPNSPQPLSPASSRDELRSHRKMTVNTIMEEISPKQPETYSFKPEAKKMLKKGDAYPAFGLPEIFGGLSMWEKRSLFEAPKQFIPILLKAAKFYWMTKGRPTYTSAIQMTKKLNPFNTSVDINSSLNSSIRSIRSTTSSKLTVSNLNTIASDVAVNTYQMKYDPPIICLRTKTTPESDFNAMSQMNCITAMKYFEDFSFEELRLEDYSQRDILAHRSKNTLQLELVLEALLLKNAHERVM